MISRMVARSAECDRDVGPIGERRVCGGPGYARLVGVLGQPVVCKSCFDALATDADPCVRTWLAGAELFDGRTVGAP